jgi:excisionase family DNA binding protein
VLTVKGAAERAGVSVSLIYAWCERRLLTHFRVGVPGKRGKILIAEADLDAYLANLKVEGAIDQAPPPSPK